MKKFLRGLIIVLVFSIASRTLAASLPAGGSSFSNATTIGAGTYQGTLAPNTESYYQVAINTGQEIDTKGSFGIVGGENMYSLGTAYIYDGNQEERDSIYGAGGTMEPYLSKANQNMYIKLVNDSSEDTVTYNLEIGIQNRFDAGSQTDAGDSFDTAMSLVPGNYSGYLAGVSVMQTPHGDDFKDYYKVSVLKGVNYEFKMTPPSGGDGNLELFNNDRESIDESSSASTGAVTSIFLTPAINTTAFVAVGSGYYDGVVSYKLNITSTEPVKEFYGCVQDSCKSVGKFVSSTVCQQTTTKECYTSSDCNNNCSSVPPTTKGTTTTKGVTTTKGTTTTTKKVTTTTKNTTTTKGDRPPLTALPLGERTTTTLIGGLVTTTKPLVEFNRPFTQTILFDIILGILVIAAIIVLILYLTRPKDKENFPTPVFSGSKEADKPVVGYKHTCNYCEKLIPPNSTVCPLCGKENPLGPGRCPKCHQPIQKDWKVCNNCGQNLRIVCPFCKKVTFFGDYCEDCDARLLVTCSHCGQEQPPLGDKCMKCGKALEKK